MRVKEVHIPRRDDRLAQLVAQLDDFAVDVPQRLVVRHAPLAHQKRVVAHGLDFQIVIPRRDFLDFLPRLIFQHRAVEFARLARAADNQPFAVAVNHETRHVRAAAEVVQMPDGHQSVEVDQPLLTFHQQNDVVAFADGAALEGVQVAEFGEPVLFLGDFEHLRQTVRRRGRVVDGAVGIFEAHAQRLADALQFERLQFRQQLARQGQRIQNRRVELAPQPAQLRFEQLAVKRGVVGGNRGIADEVHQLRDSGLRRFFIRQHHVRNARNFGNFRPQGNFRVHQNRQRIHQRAAGHFHRADFNHAVFQRVQPGGFKVQHDDGIINRAVVFISDNLRFVDKVALAARNQLNRLLFDGIERRRERLHHTVVGNRDGGMPPLDGTLDEVARRGQRVHGGHVGVHVQLDALFFRRVLAPDALHRHHIADGNGQLVREVIVHALAAHLDVQTHLDLVDLVHHRLTFLVGNRRRRRVVVLLLAEGQAAVAHERLAEDGRRVVGDGKGDEQQFAALEFLRFQLENVALHDDQPRVACQLLHFHRRIGNRAPHNRLADGVVGHHGQHRVALRRCLLRLLLARRGRLALLVLLRGLGVPLRHRGDLLRRVGDGLLAQPLFADFRQPLLLIARDGQFHHHLGGKNVLHRL